MKRSVTITVVVLAVLAGVVWMRMMRTSADSDSAGSSSTRSNSAAPGGRIAAPGLVEAASEEVSVRAEIAGRLTEVMVEEGQEVAAHEVIAKVDDAGMRARVDAAEADVQQREAELAAVLNGANQLQRREAWVGMKEAEAVVEQGRVELARRRALFAQGLVAREQVDLADRDLNVDQQRAEAAAIQRDLTGAHAIDTDRHRAEAAVRAAKAGREEARLMRAKTLVRAPITGVVLHTYLHTGELVSEGSKPIATLADLSKLRIRAEVDEADVASVKLDQKAFVTAPTYGDRRFTGHVIRIANVLGRKNVRTGDPAERVDTRVLETLIELDPGAQFPLGLRVTAYLLVDR